MGENYFGITDTGRQRTNNEDSFIAQTVGQGRYIAACVIDGVGGYEGGEIAAQLTRQSVISSLGKLKEDIAGELMIALADANEAIIKKKQTNAGIGQMACVATLAVADMEKNTFHFAHVGDTRLYLFRDGSLIKVTHDHSTVGFLEDSGRLTEAAAMAHPKRNEVNKVLGYESGIARQKDFIDTGASPFLPGDIILLCSDGLTDMIPSGRIISILSTGDSLPARAALLIKAANEAGGKDNITVVLVHNNKLPAQHAITKPLIIPKKNEPNGNGDTKIVLQEKKDLLPEKKNKGRSFNGWLFFFCIVFFLGFTWLLLNRKTDTLAKPLPVPTIRQRNRPEINFLDSINARTTTTVNLSGNQPLIVTDTLLIKNDTLHIAGNGNTLTRDSTYAGPAFVIAASCKYILLDSLTIENFNVGISVLNKGLHLKNVRFKNCGTPLLFQQQLPSNAPVSGKQAETIFYFTDSLHK